MNGDSFLNNKLEKIPSEFCVFKDIREFSFSSNLFKRVPNCLSLRFNKMKADSAQQKARNFFSEKNYVKAYNTILFSINLDTTDFNKFFIFCLSKALIEPP